MEIGICTFADLSPDPKTGLIISAEQRMKNLLEEMVLADKVGLDIFGLGEHHRSDFIVSNPVVAMSAGAALTKNIRFTSAVTVLSSADPVRVFQEFSELDLVSGGRAELIVGRGSFIESFPLFGNNLDDYDDLFKEKLELLLKLRQDEKITWSGNFRPSINDRGVYPRPVQKSLPIWIGVGGTPASVQRAGKLGLPLTIAIIGGYPEHFVPLVELYKNTAKANGHDELALCINSHGFVLEDSDEASKVYYPYYSAFMNKIGKERGWGPMGWDSFNQSKGPEGFLLVGNPEEVAAKIIKEYDLFGHQRFMMQISVGAMPHDKVLESIEVLGTKVAPLVRQELKRRKNKNS